MKIYFVSYDLAEVSYDTIPDNIDNIMFCYFSTDIESITIEQVFLGSTCLSEIIDLLKTPVALIVVPMIMLNSIFQHFSNTICEILRFQHFSFCIVANINKLLLFVVPLHNSKVIAYLKGPSFWVCHIGTKLYR